MDNTAVNISLNEMVVGAGGTLDEEKDVLQVAAKSQTASIFSGANSKDVPISNEYDDLYSTGVMANAVNLELPIKHTLSPIVTTASVLAIVYKDGIMMCSDTLASYGRMSRFKGVTRYIVGGVEKNILLCSSGDYSDYQTLQKLVRQQTEQDYLHYDNSSLTASNFASWLSRIFYFRRGRFNPYWQSICIAGINKNNKQKHFYHHQNKNNDQTGRYYLGYVDLWGTFFQEKTLATGLGRYFSLTLMRKYQRDDMPEEEARTLLENGMKILFARDCYANNKIQFAKVTEEGVTIEEPYCIDTKWDYEHYQKKTTEMDLAGCSW